MKTILIAILAAAAVFSVTYILSRPSDVIDYSNEPDGCDTRDAIACEKPIMDAYNQCKVRSDTLICLRNITTGMCRCIWCICAVLTKFKVKLSPC